MKIKYLFQILIFLMTISILYANSYALEKDTHKNVNEYIANNVLNGFLLDEYLKTHLGLFNGIEETFRSKRVWKWLGEGGKKEDEPTQRCANHFHNPLESNLSDAGWSGFAGTGFPQKGESTILWAQKDRGEQSANGTDYSWKDTREYFYKALTLKSEGERDEYYSKTFQGLGQLMHLVCDMSVPEHTRDDGHYLANLGFTYYEQWVGKKIQSPEDLNLYPAIYFDSTYLKNPSQFSEAPVPIANLFDTNQYQMETQPSVTTNNSTIGLSEYTNANFLSPDTMFTSNFPYPSLDNCYVYKGENMDRMYVHKGVGDGGEAIEHLAVVSFLYLWRWQYFPNDNGHWPIGMDAECYKEYSTHLIPRAVGYSASLLKYFFRGTIEITDPVIRFSGFAEGFDSVTLFAGNTSLEQEEMGSGTVSLVIKYKYDENDQYLSVPEGFRDDVDEFYYIVKDLEDTHSIPVSTAQAPDSIEFQFDLSDSPIPLNAKEIYVYVVYRGQLGNEADGIGVGYKEVALRNIEIKVSNKGVYALSDLDIDTIDPTREGFDHISVFAKNISTDGIEMNGGAVSLMVKYMVGQNNQFQNWPPEPDQTFEHTIKTLAGGMTIPRDDYIFLEFDLTDKPIPLYATDVYLYLLYNETTGSGAQSAFVGFKDICEPTPLVYYNSKDKICISSQAYVAGSDTVISLVDTNHNGIADPPYEWDVYAHDRQNVYIRYSPIDDPQWVSTETYNYLIPYQAAGEYTSLYVLSDDMFNDNASNGEIIVMDPRDQFTHYSGNYQGSIIGISGVKNQYQVIAEGDPGYNADSIGYARSMSWFHTYRDIENCWIHHAILNPPYPEGTSCTIE